MGINTKSYIEKFLKIRDKNGQIIDFKINEPQMKLYNAIKKCNVEKRPCRIVILKARQMGFSTLTEAIIFKTAATEKNIGAAAVAHEKDATNNLLKMFKRYYDNLPEALKPERKKSNAKEVEFASSNGTGLNSSIQCFTAGNENIGRSATLRYVHLSEFAFWPGEAIDAFASIMQAVPSTPESMVIIESTANGYNEFKKIWDKAVKGENDFIPIFCAWHELEEYKKPYDGFALTPEELELKEIYDLTNEQITWRRWCIKNNCNSSINKFKQEYPSYPEEAFIMTGTPVFDNEKIISRINMLEKLYAEEPYLQGSFLFDFNNPETKDVLITDSIKFSANSKASIKIYEEPLPGYPYVIGGDTKGEGKDFYTATVINNVTGNRAATLRMQLNNSSSYTHQLYCLGIYYNNALIGIEINFNTAPIEELQRLKYPKQYVRRKYDNYNKKLEKKYGWKTDGNTRPLIIDKEVNLFEEHIDLINDIDTLREAITFVYDKNGRPDALSGNHDDLLLSEMIASEIRSQQSYEISETTKVKAKWTEDMYDDYYKANAEAKRILIEKWGKPN